MDVIFGRERAQSQLDEYQTACLHGLGQLVLITLRNPTHQPVRVFAINPEVERT